MSLLWWSAVVAVVLATLGLVFMLAGVLRMSGTLKKSMLLLLVAATFAVGSALATSVFGLNELPLENGAWNIHVILFTIAMLIFPISMKYLADTLETLERPISS